MKQQILELHLNIFKYLKKKAHSFEGRPSSELKRYREDQDYYSTREFQLSSQEDLNSSIINSQLIYLGDFHTFDQNQRSLHRIMRVLQRNKKKFKLAIEMVHHKHQFFLESYLKGHITELEFLESIDYTESWRFPWSHYKMIFDFIKEFEIEVIALNCTGNLKKRDELAANILCHELAVSPDVPILVLYGELHILPNKLPQRVLIKSKKNLRHCIIHQNLDEVYWGLVNKNESSKIVKFSRDEYCLITSPPWVKYESMVYWYENMLDDPEFDIHEYIIENGLKIFSSNSFENFLQICTTICNNLGLDLTEDEIEDFNLYDHSGLEFIEEEIEKLNHSSLQNYLLDLISRNKSFKLPFKNIYYCSNYSMNKMAALAGKHIYHNYLKRSQDGIENVYLSKDQIKKFIFLTQENMFSYFFTKIFNPHRKCDLYIDFELKAKTGSTKKERELFQNLLDLIDDKVEYEELFKAKSLKFLNNLARPFGYFLGESLYHALSDHSLNMNSVDFTNYYLQSPIEFFNFQRIKKQILPNRLYRMQKKRFF